MGDSSSDDDKNDIWSWGERQRQNLKAEHDRFFQNEGKGKRLEQDDEQQNGIDHNNPFSSFKKFVDNTLFGVLSSSLDFRTAWKKEMERHQAEELDISYRWTGSLDSPDDIKKSIETLTPSERQKAFDAAMVLEHQAYLSNEHVPADKIKALYNDPESNWGYLDLLGLEVRRGDGISGTILERLGAQPRWLSFDWFKRSSYSPIRLEAYSEMSASGHRWRAAFEDLLNASLDKPMQSDIDAVKVGQRQPFGKPHSLYCAPGLDWMLSLHCRGILPSRFPALCERRAISDISDFHSNRNKWAIDGVLPGGSRMQEYVADLVKEVATPATGDTLTEQDLYDALEQSEAQDMAPQQLGREDFGQDQPGSGKSPLEQYQMELMLLEQQNKKLFQQARQEQAADQQLLQSNSNDQTPYDRWLPTGDRQLDRWDAQDLLEDACDSEDVKNATKVLTIWYNKYHDVDDLCQGQLDNILIQALRESHIPLSRWAKYEQLLNTRMAQSMAQRRRDLGESSLPDCEPEGQLSPEDQQKKEELVRKICEIAPKFLQSSDLVKAPMYNLEEILESLQQQRDCLELTTEKYQEQKEKLELWRRFDLDLDSYPVVMKKPIDPEPVAMKKPNVLSALTTTHTTRLPDGTVTTKVVLKKRFSDGREETTESVHTTNENLEHQQQQEVQPKKKGWFWS